MSELIASNTLMYIASRNRELPTQAISRLTPVAERQIDAVAPMFPGVLEDDIKKFIRSTNASQNYGMAGFEIRFAAGYDFDIDAFVDSVCSDESLIVEAHIIKFPKGKLDSRGKSTYRSGTTSVENPGSFNWTMLSRFRMEKLRKVADETGQRYLRGERVVATGQFHKLNDSRVASEIKTLGGLPQERVDEKTTLVLIGHNPDKAIVSHALDRQLNTMHGHLFGFLVQYGRQNNWQPPAEFRTENTTKKGNFIIRERYFSMDHGEFVLTGRTIAHVARIKDKAQQTLQRLSASHRREFLRDFPQLKGQRIFDIVALKKENELFLVFNGDGCEPHKAAEHKLYGEFLIFAESEEKAHKLATADLHYYDEDTLHGEPEQLAADPDSLLQHVQDSRGLSYDEDLRQLNIASSVQPAVMAKLNSLLTNPVYIVRAVSPIDVMRYEAELTQVTIL